MIVLLILVLFGLVWFMVFNTTFNNISAILWGSVLLVEKTEVPGENHQPVTSH
jgi:ABC-type Mn2+/Zn2+ transport system permease subunit